MICPGQPCLAGPGPRAVIPPAAPGVVVLIRPRSLPQAPGSAVGAVSAGGAPGVPALPRPGCKHTGAGTGWRCCRPWVLVAGQGRLAAPPSPVPPGVSASAPFLSFRPTALSSAARRCLPCARAAPRRPSPMPGSGSRWDPCGSGRPCQLRVPGALPLLQCPRLPAQDAASLAPPAPLRPLPHRLLPVLPTLGGAGPDQGSPLWPGLGSSPRVGCAGAAGLSGAAGPSGAGGLPRVRSVGPGARPGAAVTGPWLQARGGSLPSVCTRGTVREAGPGRAGEGWRSGARGTSPFHSAGPARRAPGHGGCSWLRSLQRFPGAPTTAGCSCPAASRPAEACSAPCPCALPCTRSWGRGFLISRFCLML